MVRTKKGLENEVFVRGFMRAIMSVLRVVEQKQKGQLFMSQIDRGESLKLNCF